MDIQTDIKWIHKELDKVTDKKLVETIKNILEQHSSSVQEPIDIEQYNKEIDEALDDINNNRLHSHEEVGQIIKKWKKR